MSTANHVPETWGLTGDDALQTLERTGRWALIRDAFKRLRYADGFSHARSIAYLTTLVFLQAVIALVGLASALRSGRLSDAIVKTLRQVVPGPAGKVLTDAVQQAHKAGSSHRYLALIIGLAGAFITGTTLMGQIERALNRIYGVEQDRPTLQKYGRAFVLTLTAGILFVVAFAALALGRAIGSSLSNHTVSSVWNVARWPLALGLLIAAIALAVQLVSSETPARMVMAGVRRDRLRRLVDHRDGGPRRDIPVQLDLRDDLRSSRRDRRAHALGGGGLDRAALRRIDRSPARGRARRSSRSTKYEEGDGIRARPGVRPVIRRGDQNRRDRRRRNGRPSGSTIVR